MIITSQVIHDSLPGIQSLVGTLHFTHRKIRAKIYGTPALGDVTLHPLQFVDHCSHFTLFQFTVHNSLFMLHTSPYHSIKALCEKICTPKHKSHIKNPMLGRSFVQHTFFYPWKTDATPYGVKLGKKYMQHLTQETLHLILHSVQFTVPTSHFLVHSS